MMCGIGGGGGAPFLGKPHPLEVFDLRLLYIPHPRFTVNTTCICSPAHAACCVSTCRCHTPCIAMKITCVCVCVCVCVCEHMYSCILTFTHVSLAHILTYICTLSCVCVCVCVCVYLCMVVTSWSLSQHHWGFQALGFWHSPLLLSM